ncbi:uncharacterized protein LOC106476727, partial [Limulus polyphemus]|uniref:Uncharacterized protein LOC106476727 n=1 Tax=Limulus polyphemus TaxID=6850 RepID=A0ABM1C1Z3_LIMPO
MYSFVRGSRLFVKGSRERDDADNVPDPGDQLEPEDSLVQAVYQTRAQMASASQESREVYRTAHNRSGLRTVQTSRIIRKTTTLTRGEHKTVSSPETHTTDHAGTQTKALPRRSSATSTDSEFAEKAKRIYKKTSETKPRKKPK